MTVTQNSSECGSYSWMLKASNLQIAEALGLSVRRVQVIRKHSDTKLGKGSEDAIEAFAGHMAARYSELRRQGKLPEPTPVVTRYYPKENAVHA